MAPVTPSIDGVSSKSSSCGNFVDRGSDDFSDESPEFASHYGPGKLHPVHFGDLFDRSRYKVLRKLGAGSFSTVWLARDKRMRKYVALKVPTADPSVSDNEMKIHKHLSHQKIQHPGQKHITTLLDSFEHHGPNGSHRCLILDVMGPNVNNMVTKIPKHLRPPIPERKDPFNKTPRYPIWMVRSMLRQILLGLAYLHKCSIVHGDLQPGNILFSVKNLSSLAEKDLAHSEVWPKTFEKVVNRRGEVRFHDIEENHGWSACCTPRRIEDKINPSLPRYIVTKEPMFDHVDLEEALHVKISDLGGAVLDSQGKPVTPLGLRSPEMILGAAIGPPQDIWSFGCLLFELMTSSMLFSVLSPHAWGKNEPLESGREEDDVELWAETNDAHILDITKLLGPVPPSFMSRFPRSNTYFNSDGEIIKDYVGEPFSDGETDDGFQMPRMPDSIEDYLDQEKGAELCSEEAQIVKKLLRAILKFEPTDRPTAEELLADPWFSEPTAPRQKSAHDHDCQHTIHQSHHEQCDGDQPDPSRRKSRP